MPPADFISSALPFVVRSVDLVPWLLERLPSFLWLELCLCLLAV